MKYKDCFALVSFSALALLTPSLAQTRKPVAIKKPPISSTERVNKPPFQAEDLKYYVVVNRAGGGTKSNYALSNNSPAVFSTQLGLQSPNIVLDVRTMKELSWWPEGDNFIKDEYLYAFSPLSYGPRFIKFPLNGEKIIYNKVLNQDKAGRGDGLNVSADLKHVYYLSNKDAWVGDFNLSTGDYSTLHQVTQAGTIESIQGTYMRGNTLLAGEYMINTETGAYVKTNALFDYITPQAKNIFYGLGNYSRRDFDGFWDLTTQKKLLGNRDVIHWINKEQTKLLVAAVAPDHKTDKVVYDFNKTTLYGKPVAWSKSAGQSIDGKIWRPIEGRLSPNSKYFFKADVSLTNQQELGLYIFDTEAYTEEYIPIDGGIDMMKGHNDHPECVWIDNTHLMFPLKEGSNVKGQILTTETQGTYVLDIISKEVKRITSYLIDFYKDDVVLLPDANIVLFEANNYLFSCKPNGSEVKQLTTPKVYKLKSAFLNRDY